GYHGRAAIVDLTSGALEVLRLPEEVLRSYLGGAGLAARLLLDHAPAGVEPLSADNPVIIAAAPLIDSGLPADARTALGAKSPLTGFIGDSMVSGDLGLALKRAGFDALILRGSCPQIAVLVIRGE